MATYASLRYDFADQITGELPTAAFADDSITLAKMVGGTDGNLIGYDASGNPAAIATGSSGQVLTSGGSGVASSFGASPSGGKILQVVHDNDWGGYTFTTSYTDVYSCTISNVAASSYVHVWWAMTVHKNSTGTSGMMMRILRGNSASGTNLISGTGASTESSAFHYMSGDFGGSDFYWPCSGNVLDTSPATGSNTYTISAAEYTGAMTIQHDGQKMITLMEIAV